MYSLFSGYLQTLLQIDRGSCGYYLGFRSETCKFEVKEFGKIRNDMIIVLFYLHFSSAKVFCGANWTQQD